MKVALLVVPENTPTDKIHENFVKNYTDNQYRYNCTSVVVCTDDIVSEIVAETVNLKASGRYGNDFDLIIWRDPAKNPINESALRARGLNVTQINDYLINQLTGQQQSPRFHNDSPVLSAAPRVVSTTNPEQEPTTYLQI